MRYLPLIVYALAWSIVLAGGFLFGFTWDVWLYIAFFSLVSLAILITVLWPKLRR